MIKYSPEKIEKKWQRRWEELGLFEVYENSKKKKFYVLDMFPYPSSAGLHVGHPVGYLGTDIIARKRWMEGWNVLHPMGWDAFGLPAENYAIKTRVHPAITTKRAIKIFRRQIKSLGLAYDWSREVNTSRADYYKWTQWLFLLFYKNGLAYRKKAPVNWCLSCKTVLAREQVIDGKCERCKHEVVQKDLEQWFFRTTEYADRLLSDLDKIDWPEKIKEMQRNWIGKSEGVIINFRGTKDEPKNLQPTPHQNKFGTGQATYNLQSKEYDIPVFTTRPDTIFGVTYLVLAPEHPLVQKLVADGEREAVAKYISETFKKTELERAGIEKDSSVGRGAGKIGVPIGASAVNPLTGEKVPIWIADYVLYGYGTGAVMGVPAHDERDFEFARKYGLGIKYVIVPPHEFSEAKHEDIHHSVKRSDLDALRSEQGERRKEVRPRNEAYTGEGMMVNSGEFSGLTSADGRQKIASHIESKGWGSRQTNYHLRDWLVSRQRYWGAPIPIIYCKNCAVNNRKFPISNFQFPIKENFDIATIDGVEYAIIPVPEKDLPVKLPKDVDFRPTGESPLARSKSFHRVKCPGCGAPARRESDTMDTFVDSSWYYFRYCDSKNKRQFAASDKLKYWYPVDLYVGGAEHAVLHLLYARFLAKALYDLHYINFEEPFLKLRNQGLILGEDGQKMSKSRGNVINPDDVVAEHGADTLRLYEMFMGDFPEAKPWNTSSIKGVRRFLDRVWQLQSKMTPPFPPRYGGKRGGRLGGIMAQTSSFLGEVEGHKSPGDKELERLAHKTIKKVTEDIEAFKFNTAISAMMILTNAMWDYAAESPSVVAGPQDEATPRNKLPNEWYEQLVLLLYPFAPHICEEIWANLGHVAPQRCSKHIEAAADVKRGGTPTPKTFIGPHRFKKNGEVFWCGGKNSIVKEFWPVYDDKLVKDEEIMLVVQVNGKLRDTIRVPANISEEEAKRLALESAKVKKNINGAKLQKVIFVPGKLVNLVIE